MKRLFTVLAAVLLLTAALAVTASAADYEDAAEDLSAIGVFRGTSRGFELDRAPTRSEAAIMLVRLLGAEDEARAAYAAGELTMPFTDVGATAAPYVAYLYQQGITNGTSATKFGTGACSAQNYAAFLLRALGYEDSTDFAYSDALAFAQEKGFYNVLMFPGEFLRDDLAAVTYQALGTDLKDGSAYLLESLVDSGAVDKAAAAPMMEKMEAYRALQQTSAGSGAETAMDMDIAADVTMTYTGEENASFDMTMSGSTQMILDPEDIRMAYTYDMALLGETMTMGTWIKDGWTYVETAMDGVSTKIKAPMAEGEWELLESQLRDTMDAASPAATVDGLAMVDSIEAARRGADTVYTVVLSGASMDGMLHVLQDFPDGSDLVGPVAEGMHFSDTTAVYTVGRDGALKDVRILYSMTMDGDALGTPGTDLTMAYDMTVAINALGDDVKVTFPDFSDFVEMEEIPDRTDAVIPA